MTSIEDLDLDTAQRRNRAARLEEDAAKQRLTNAFAEAEYWRSMAQSTRAPLQQVPYRDWPGTQDPRADVVGVTDRRQEEPA